MTEFKIQATPEPINIDPARTAVIVVDMENDFRTKGGMFDRAGVDIAPIQKVVEPISRVLESARGARMKIIYLKMGFVRIFPTPVRGFSKPAEAFAHAMWRSYARSE